MNLRGLEFVIFVLVLKGCMISVMAMRTHTFVAIVKPAFFCAIKFYGALDDVANLLAI